MKKIALLLFIAFCILSFGTYYYIFIYSKNYHRQVDKETAIIISADSLSYYYTSNEKAANALYLNKALRITGKIIAIETNQQGAQSITLGNETSFNNVYVTLTSKSTTPLQVGTFLTIQGLCTGTLTDVIITEAIIIK